MTLTHRLSAVASNSEFPNVQTEGLSYELDDLEKKPTEDVKTIPYEYNSEEEHTHDAFVEETQLGFFSRLISSLNAEQKGIEPIEDEEKTDDSVINAASMWFSANMVIASYAMGGLGPLVYNLNFGTCVLVIVFFNILGILPVAFFSLFGIEFGLRQMILSRFMIGNVTARIFALINVIACVGWVIVNTVASAQLLNMVNAPHNCPLWAACLVIIGGTVAVTFFGYKAIHKYEKWSWVTNFAVFLVIIARLKKSGNFSNGPWTSGPTTAGNVLSFGSAVFGYSTGWTTYAADYTVYMPRSINKFKVFFCLLAGLAFPLFFTMIIGAAVANGAVNNKEWNDYYQQNSMGGVTYAVLVPNSLHGFGQFCCVLLAMSTIANNVPNMYSIALSAQALWAPFAKVPRAVWTVAGNAAALGIGIPACYYFEGFMEYFMNSIAYYLAIYSALAIPEHYIFRKGFKGYQPEYWNDWNHLPIGYAGTTAFIVGCFGVALGMDQTYWVGEIGRLIGADGGDIGFELGAAWATLVYIILRPLEIKYTGR